MLYFSITLTLIAVLIIISLISTPSRGFVFDIKIEQSDISTFQSLYKMGDSHLYRTRSHLILLASKKCELSIIAEALFMEEEHIILLLTAWNIKKWEWIFDTDMKALDKKIADFNTTQITTVSRNPEKLQNASFDWFYWIESLNNQIKKICFKVFEKLVEIFSIIIFAIPVLLLFSSSEIFKLALKYLRNEEPSMFGIKQYGSLTINNNNITNEVTINNGDNNSILQNNIIPTDKQSINGIPITSVSVVYEVLKQLAEQRNKLYTENPKLALFLHLMERFGDIKYIRNIIIFFFAVYLVITGSVTSIIKTIVLAIVSSVAVSALIIKILTNSSCNQTLDNKVLPTIKRDTVIAQKREIANINSSSTDYSISRNCKFLAEIGKAEQEMIELDTIQHTKQVYFIKQPDFLNHLHVAVYEDLRKAAIQVRNLNAQGFKNSKIFRQLKKDGTIQYVVSIFAAKDRMDKALRAEKAKWDAECKTDKIKAKILLYDK